MKTIRLISSVAFSAASLAASLHAQDFREIPVTPDPKEEPLTMERLYIEERAKEQQQRDHLPPIPDESPANPKTESEEIQRQMLDRIHQHMLLEQPKPEFQEAKQPDWVIGLGVEPLDPFVRDHLRLDENSGARVSLVAKDLPAAAAGIEINDIIVSANGRNITKVDELREIVDQSGKEGRPIAMIVVHQGERRPVVVIPKSTKPVEPPEEAGLDRPAPERPFAEFAKRLERQEKQIRELQKEVRRLRKELREDRDEDHDDHDHE